MIANLVEGAFGRVFRAEVRPMELARKLAREMDSHRTVSLSRVYVPNEYAVWLSPRDRERYEGVEHEVIEELCSYLLEHARREQLIMASQPRISFHTDERLSLGEFGIEARLARHDDVGEHEPPALAAGHGETMVYSPAAPRAPAPESGGPARPLRALLAVGGRRMLLGPEGGTIGRSRDCDVVLEDAGISRQHAHIRPSGGGWVVEDLGSTNGVRVNGRELRGAQRLDSGDRVELGSTEAVFELS